MCHKKVIILTAPYSGSSFLAERLICSGFSCPGLRAHYEPQAFVHLNDKVIAASGGLRSEESIKLFFSALEGKYTKFVLKDPQFALALKYYPGELLKDYYFVINLRDYEAVIRHMVSVRERFNIGSSDGERIAGANSELFAIYDSMLAATSKYQKVHIVNFESLLSGEKDCWDRLQSFLGIALYKCRGLKRKTRGVLNEEIYVDPKIKEAYIKILERQRDREGRSIPVSNPVGKTVYRARWLRSQTILKVRRHVIDDFPDNFWVREWELN